MPTVNEVAPLTLHSPPDNVNTVHDYIQRVWLASPDLDAMDKLEFETALVELAANIIEHSNEGGGVEGNLNITIHPDRIRCDITDTSEPSNVALGARHMPEEYAESGRGIAFIQRLVDVLQYERRDGENFWMIEKLRERHGA
ncbi:MAG: putative regulator [Microbacteriaceae bacterium]|jgi:serine/threonine-protein kinase RsbW|nr:putative regulator [Microbacteriaceae bacterium]